MAFLLPLGELVMEGIGAGMAQNMGREIYDQFAPRLKEGAVDLAGRKIGEYAQDHPTGFIAETLEKSYQYSKLPREKTHHNHRHKRSGHRRTH
jgi:hypothetical protein